MISIVMNKCLYKALCISLFFPLIANAASYIGSGHEISTGFGIYKIDNVYFTANTTGTIDISVFAEGTSDSLDTFIRVYIDDSDLTQDDLLDFNDDAAVPVTTNSTDSFLTLNVEVGQKYVLRISSFDFLSSNIGDYNYDFDYTSGYTAYPGFYGYTITEVTGSLVGVPIFVGGSSLSLAPSPSDGDVTLDGIVDIRDVLLTQQALQGQMVLTAEQLYHADVAPLLASDGGAFDLANLLLITRKALGEVSF